METVFITIHDLSLDARIKYCSDSVEDILGYLPHEVKGKTCWEFFHPEEIPFAKAVHGRGVSLDKAAVLNYCRIKHKDGSWVGCECVFTVVYDVLVASTAIYQLGPKSHKRAIDGAGIRRIFSSAPKDPRYHMLSYISDKFYQEPQPHAREPRAALFLNRFTRTSTIMFATNGVAQILGIQPSQLVGKSFYYCIAQNCLDDAIKCLESAKANDSIAYLRFWYRDPTQAPISFRQESSLSSASEDDDDDGGVSIASTARSQGSVQIPSPTPFSDGGATPRAMSDITPPLPSVHVDQDLQNPNDTSSPNHVRQSRSSSDESSGANGTSSDSIFDAPSLRHHSSASTTTPMEDQPAIEIEAVISCTSDGLVLVMRRARPLVPHTPDLPDTPYYANGLFASPWASQPLVPSDIPQTTITTPLNSPPTLKQSEAGFMAAIRDIAVFAWSLTGINGSLVEHARGKPFGEAQPPLGLPVWDPTAKVDADANTRWNGFSHSTHRRITDLGIGHTTTRDEDTTSTSSEDEVLFKRVPHQPPWRRPRRRAHRDAFGSEGDGEDADSEDVGRRTTKRGKVGTDGVHLT